MAKLPIAPFEKIMKENGAKRVAFSAGEALAELTGDIAAEIAKNASLMADHAGRTARKNLRINL
jgi:histone H3/H4